MDSGLRRNDAFSLTFTAKHFWPLLMTVNIDKDSFVLNPRYRLQWEPAQNCHVLLYPEGLIQLSGSAAEIMQRCTQPTTMIAMVADLEQQFPDAEGIAEDVREFLQDAQQQHWIVAA